MGAVSVYSFSDVSMVISHPKVGKLTITGEGVGSISIARANDRIREKLNAMAHGSAYSKYLQESIVTVRNGRYVLPVRAEYRANVPGIVQDQSSTGATLFIEPLAVVELSNDIREWQSKEKQEIERMAAIKAENLRKQQELNKNKLGAEMGRGKK